MPADGKTIQIYLPSGEPQGLRIAEITTRTIQAVQVPRLKLADFFARRESEQIGVYFLFGEREESAKPVVYVGQTEDLKARLKKHHADKEFWTTAVVVISRTHSFTQAHLRYLEWWSIKGIEEAKRYELDNGNAGAKPYVPEPLEADVLDGYGTAAILLATLGFPVFEPAAGRKAPPNREVFMCKGPNAEARGALVEDGFVIFSGSKTRRKTPPASEKFSAWIEALVKDKVLEPINGEECRLTQDYVVNSPSYAAALVLARHANGWNEWKRADGKSLHDVYRATAEEE